MRRGGSKADVWEEDGGRASRETELGGALCEHMGNNGANSRIGAEVLGQQEWGLEGGFGCPAKYGVCSRGPAGVMFMGAQVGPCWSCSNTDLNISFIVFQDSFEDDKSKILMIHFGIGHNVSL